MKRSAEQFAGQTGPKRWLAAAVLALFLPSSYADARITPPPGEPAGRVSISCKAGGLFTDRLTGKQLRIWRSILDLILARDRSDMPLHPTLNRLWHQAEDSGHVIHIELSDRRCPTCATAAGSCTVERLDPAGLKHILVIRLDLDMIHRAHVGKLSQRPDGFIPLRGLRKEERYAEVLGHELAHAVQLSLDADYMRLYQEMNRQARRYMDSRGLEHRRPEDQRLRAEMRELLEEPAEAAEVAIWRELMAGHHAELQSPLSGNPLAGRAVRHGPGSHPNAGRHAEAVKRDREAFAFRQ